MYTGFNAKKARKRTKIEKLQDEIKKLHQMLGAMIHVHERMKNERSKGSENPQVSTLPGAIAADGERTESPRTLVLEGEGGKPMPGKD